MADEINAEVAVKPRFSRRALGRWILAAGLAAVGVVFVAYPDFIAKYTGYNRLSEHAMGLVDETLKRDQNTFLAITAIKTSLAVIEGSQVGVGFELEIGDVVQPAYDYVNFFWEMFLYAFLIMGTYKILIETGMLMLGIGLMGLGLVVFGCAVAGNGRAGGLWRWGRRTFLAGALFAYAVPLALVATNALSERYTTKIRQKHYESIRRLETKVGDATVQFMALKGQINILEPTASFDRVKTGMLTIVRSIGRTFQEGLTAFLYYMLVIAFEVVFFPFLSAYFLYKFAQFALGRIVPAQSVEAISPIPARI